MEDISKEYICIHCSAKVKELYKKYSPTVLKLSTCNTCQNIADKYVEYDPVIITIDLILLSREAYRHVIYNTDFKLYWKLALLLQVVEAFYEWMTVGGSYDKNHYNKTSISVEDIHVDNLEFYKTVVIVSLRTICYITSICLLTWIYNKAFKKTKGFQISLLHVCKSNILASIGVFLVLPAIIWGQQTTIMEFHTVFVTIYTTYSQLVAYTVVCKCSKIWSIVVILTSYLLKTVIFDTNSVNTNFRTINYNYSTIM